jgi:hypothetical protein
VRVRWYQGHGRMGSELQTAWDRRRRHVT